MFKGFRSNPLWLLFFEDKLKNLLLSALAIFCNLASAILEGLSFTFILFSFTFLNGESSSYIPVFLREYLAGLTGIELFSICILGAVISQLIRSSFAYFGQMITVLLTVKLQNEAQKRTYCQIFRLSFAAINRYKIGDLIHYATAPPNYFRHVTEWLNKIFVSVLMIFTYIIFMMALSFKLTCCILVLFFVAAILQKKLIKRIMKASEIQSDHLVELNKETAQNLSGLRTVHLFDRQQEVLKNIGMRIREIAKASLRLNKWNQLINPLNEGIGVLLVASSMILGLYILKLKDANVFPLLMTFLALTYRFGTRLQVVMSGLGEVAFNIGPILRLKDILADEDKEFLDLNDKPSACFQSEIQFENLSLQYPGKETYAVRNVSLSIPKGGTIAFVGPSGGGKSSLLDLLLRLYEPTGGKIYVDGKPINHFSLGSWRDLFGVVSQDVFLFHESIESNIRFGNLKATASEIMEAAQLAGADTFIKRLPNGYKTLVGEKGHRLSGGEKQRISLARALVRKPEVLVLDEATSNLDSHSEKIIQEALEKLRGKTTILVVAHRLATINMADHIFFLDRGKIIEQGTHADLIQLGGRYNHFWNLQTKEKEKTYFDESALIKTY